VDHHALELYSMDDAAAWFRNATLFRRDGSEMAASTPQTMVDISLLADADKQYYASIDKVIHDAAVAEVGSECSCDVFCVLLLR
jgi:hypothetical protein